MTKSITIRGYSDDTISCAGDLADEFYDPKQRGSRIEFSDGTVLHATFGDTGPTWELAIAATGTAHVHRDPATDEFANYSDIVTITGDLEWVRVTCHGLTRRCEL